MNDTSGPQAVRSSTSRSTHIKSGKSYRANSGKVPGTFSVLSFSSLSPQASTQIEKWFLTPFHVPAADPFENESKYPGVKIGARGKTVIPISTTFAQFGPGTVFAGPPPPSSQVGSYTLLNLRGAYRFWKQQAAVGYFREAEVAVSAFNALNDKHKEHPLGETIGRIVMGWLTVKF